MANRVLVFDFRVVSASFSSLDSASFSTLACLVRFRPFGCFRAMFFVFECFLFDTSSALKL